MFDIDFSNGCMNSFNQQSGLETMIMNEREIAERFISEFKCRYSYGCDPNEVIEGIAADWDFDDSDLLQETVDFINKEIAKIVEGR